MHKSPLESHFLTFSKTKYLFTLYRKQIVLAAGFNVQAVQGQKLEHDSP